MNLFQENKYPILIGSEGASVGFCTVWNKLDVATKVQPAILERSSLAGTLYSRQGVNPILRNLALNPHIRYLLLWGHGPLSNTPFGRSGTDILKALWEDGIQGDGTIGDTGFAIDEEIDLEVVNLIVKNVSLMDVSDHDLASLEGVIPKEQGEMYMEAVEFPPPVPRAVSTFPSEHVGFTVHGRTVLDAWHQIVFRIMRYGIVKGTQYGMEQRELPGLQWVVKNEKAAFPDDVPEDWPKELRETVGVTKESIGQYHDVFLSSEAKEGVAYTYGSRLRNMVHSSGDISCRVDQIKDSIIRNLKNSPDSRRGVATTLIPNIDAYAKEPPCIISVQCLQSKGFLHLFATFRSHDIFKAAIPNAFGLIAMQDEIAEATGFQRGHLCINSISAHIYEGDFEHAEKLVDCAFLGKDPEKVWKADGADLRGSIVIRVEGDEIVAEHQSPDGALLKEYRGKTAREISLVLGQHAIVSQVSHALDLGHELQKAEHAIRLNISYGQDQKLSFSK